MLMEPIWQLFHENSKTSRLGTRLGEEYYLQEIGEIAESIPHEESETFDGSSSSVRSLVVPLGDVLLARESARTFENLPISFDALSLILQAGYGRSAINRLPQWFPRHTRTVPSGGGLYPLDLYVIYKGAEDVETLHYDPISEVFQRLVSTKQLKWDAVCTTFAQPELIESATALVVMVGVFERSCCKYGEKGYRFVLIESGHVAQNIVLAATALGLKSCCIAGFYDDDLNSLLGLDGLNESVVYCVALGGAAEQLKASNKT